MARRRRRANGQQWLWWGLLGVGAFFFLRQAGTPVAVSRAQAPSPTQSPITYWINPSGDLSTIVRQPGIAPPYGFYRPASEYELSEASSQGLV